MMNIKDFNRTHFLFGLFYEEDFSYEANKGKFFNEIKKKFKDRHKIVYISDPRIGDNMLDESNSTFKIVAKKNSLHFENNCSKENFIRQCNEIVEIYNQTFENLDINKIGFIEHFEIKKQGNDFIKSRFFKNLPSYPLSQLDFHINYEKRINDRNYNFNLVLNQNNYTKVINGSLDMNISNSLLKIIDIPKILDTLDYYYKDEFIKDFFFDNGK